MVARLPKVPHDVWFLSTHSSRGYCIADNPHNRRALDPAFDPWSPETSGRAIRVVTRRRSDGLEARQPPAQAR